ncbi:thioredoxin family protein [uncultured Flavobacterium sp.]|uniref:thioredoxin family protein n=1 Tax=uncultured Flavobacterium sp. TaxID=165435 RepID=UPI0025FEC1B4|nr:thioredoxin family protein [uncultured Flavobacterium sp.]
MKLKTLLLCLLFLGTISTTIAQEKASVVLEKAMAQAKKEKKNVFVMYHASWCGWCKKMEASMQNEDVKPFFDKNYVTTFLTVQERKDKSLENPGADEILKKYKADQSGIPFWQIYDADGKLLADSFDAKGQNLGCPSTKEEVAAFTDKLKKTSSLTENQRKKIEDVFVIKKK